MKKVVIVLMAAVMAMTAAAVNRLYLPDFTICPGETMQVALILENDSTFTAFQTDLILPEGLTVIQEDDEFLFDLSGRKARDHTIISKQRDDGAIRMVSFSIGVKPYSGSDGALVIINLKADEDFTPPATVRLKNSICATLAGKDIFLAGEDSNVFQLEELLPGDVNGDGNVNVADVAFTIDYLLNGCTSSFHTQNADLNHNGTVDVGDISRIIDLLLQGK